MSSKLERTTRFQGDKKFQEQMHAERETLQKIIDERAPVRNREQMNAIQTEKKLRADMKKLLNREQGKVIDATFQGKTIVNIDGKQ